MTYTTAGDPAYRAMKQYVQQPEFGKIYQVNGLFMANWCINLPEFNPDHPMHKYSWRLQAQKGFGALGTIGTHIFEYCRQLFGKEAPLSIMGSLQKTYDERELNDGGMAIINYPNQSLINIRYSLSLTSKDHHQISVNSQYQSILYNVNESYFWAVNEKGDMQKIEAQTIPDFENYANLCEKSEGWDQDNFKNYWRFKNLYDDFAQNISTSATYTKSDMEHHSGICGAKMISKILLSDKEKRQIDW